MKKLALAFCLLFGLYAFGYSQNNPFPLMEKSLFTDSRISIQVYVYGGPGVIESRLVNTKSVPIWNTIKFKIHNKTNHQLYVNFQSIVDFIDGSSEADKIGGVDPGLLLEPNGYYPVNSNGPEYAPGFGAGHLTTTRDYDIITQVNSSKESEEKLIIKNIRIDNIQVIDVTVEKEAKAAEENTQEKKFELESQNTGNSEYEDKRNNQILNSSTQNKNEHDQANSSANSKSQEQLEYDSEQAANLNRQNEYDTWKSNAINERAKLDAATTTSTVAILYLLGGIVYKDMGSFDPDLVYQSPVGKNKFKLKSFFNSQIGYGYTSVPFLYSSSIATVVNGKPVTLKSYKGYEGSYLNLSGNFSLGFQNDYYSIYGKVGAVAGVDPRFKGNQLGIQAGGGLSLGAKPIKMYGRYRINDLTDFQSISDDIEEQNRISSMMASSEYEAGIQFTLGGGSASNYKRTHIYAGVIQKVIDFDKSLPHSEGFYNYKTGAIQNFGKIKIPGYNFEIRKDHTFSLFFRYFPEHYFYGKIDSFNSANGTLSTKLENPNASFIEIGFHRCIDAFR